jgi:hypothetical protein
MTKKSIITGSRKISNKTSYRNTNDSQTTEDMREILGSSEHLGTNLTNNKVAINNGRTVGNSMSNLLGSSTQLNQSPFINNQMMSQMQLDPNNMNMMQHNGFASNANNNALEVDSLMANTLAPVNMNNNSFLNNGMNINSEQMVQSQMQNPMQMQMQMQNPIQMQMQDPMQMQMQNPMQMQMQDPMQMSEQMGQSFNLKNLSNLYNTKRII